MTWNGLVFYMRTNKESITIQIYDSTPRKPTNFSRGSMSMQRIVSWDFKAGANWKEQQIMGKAMDVHCFGFQVDDALFSFTLPAKGYLVGSQVKVIIIKNL